MKKRTIIILAMLSLISCGRFQNEDKKTELEERIVLISKQYCEIIFALEADENIVAVDLSSVYPERVKELPTVGYHRALSLEGLLAANPTLIIHDGLNSLGPEPVVDQLLDLKIPMKEFETKAQDIGSTKALIREIGAYFHKESKAEELCAKLDADIKLAIANAGNYEEKPRVMIIHFGRASNIYMIMSNSGAASKMVEWGGATMAVSDTSGMQHLSAEIVSQYNPDVILLTDFGYDQLGSEEKIKELPGVALTAAAQNNRIYRVNECDMVYLGPRSGEIAVELQKLIHQK